ncbi:hypothetical protein ACFQ61_02435 [Streptomyces sp. NPDC056500]|uniref:hypothetical protein n=1 Tax=Streptomyces sp. NPDC056500 TaxID=3345840 RepID=UPI0036AC8117
MGSPPQPSQSDTIDVKPSDLHRVSGGFASQQSMHNQAAKGLVTALREHPDAGGYGTAARSFASAYVKVGNRFLEVWAKSVVSIGGAAVGFTTTANNYSKAEAAANPSGQKQPNVQPVPQVIDKAPGYGGVPDLKWGDDDGATVGCGPSWSGYLRFCETCSEWGTTAWGKSTAGYEWKHDSASSSAGATHPVMTVLFDTATKVSDLLYEFAQAALDLNGKVWDIYMEAAREAVGKGTQPGDDAEH